MRELSTAQRNNHISIFPEHKFGVSMLQAPASKLFTHLGTVRVHDAVDSQMGVGRYKAPGFEGKGFEVWRKEQKDRARGIFNICSKGFCAVVFRIY
jgi:hypothetical protein